MGFFKSIFNDIKLSNTPLGSYKNKLVDYFNFVSIETSNKKTLSEETAILKSIALSQELYELSETLDPKGEFTIYLPNGDLRLNVKTAQLFTIHLHNVLENGIYLNITVLSQIVKEINSH